MGCNSSQDAKKVEDAAANGKKESANSINHVPDSPEKLQDISEDITPAKSEGTTDLDDIAFGEEEQKAATKIQAVFRGHQVRKKFVPVDEAAIDEEIAVKPVVGISAQNIQVDHTIEKAKEAIKEEVKMSGEKVEHEPSKAELEAEFDPQDKDLCHAATKIQASFRGHQVRKQTEKTEKADEALKSKTLTPYKNWKMNNNPAKYNTEFSALPPIFMSYNVNEEGNYRGPRPYDEDDKVLDPTQLRREINDLLENLLDYLKLMRGYVAKVRRIDVSAPPAEEIKEKLVATETEIKEDIKPKLRLFDDRVHERTASTSEAVRDGQKKLLTFLKGSIDQSLMNMVAQLDAGEELIL